MHILYPDTAAVKQPKGIQQTPRHQAHYISYSPNTHNRQQ